ncbi:MAG: hypothetical protein K2W80_09455 [Burkholderiales bacterium]|nr:hypothetical protein [Burkholderiales bacterium]
MPPSIAHPVVEARAPRSGPWQQPRQRTLRAGFHRAATVIAGAWLATALACTAFAQAPRSAQRLLVISQTAGPAGASITARIGSLTFGPTGLDSSRVAETLPDGSSIAQVAVRDFGDALPQAQLLAQASQHLGAQAPALAATLSAALQSRGLVQATFSFDQQVTVRGAASPRRLVWTLSVDRAGRASFADPRLFDAQPHILHVQYIPLRVATGLPAGWAYPEAGQLRWQRLNLMMQPIGPVATLDTGGAFDPPDRVDDSLVDPEAGLRCLIDRRARGECPQSFTDVITLIDEQGSASALVDYGLRLAPVYDAVTAGDGRVEQVARVSLQVDQRELTFGGCSADMTFRNAGRYGYTLTAASDRYAVTPDGRFARLNRTETIALSPTVAYDWSRRLRPVAASALAPMILDPHDPDRPLLAASSVGNLLSLAPITVSGEREQTVVSFTPAPGDKARLQVEVQCAIEGTWTVRSRVAPWAQCLSGSCNSTYRAYEAVFNRGQPAIAPMQFTAVTYRGQAWEPQQAGYDGNGTITVSHYDHPCGAFVWTQFSLNGQYLGTTTPATCD